MTRIPYKLIRSNRRTMSIQIMPDGGVVVRAPAAASVEAVDAFVNQKEAWIQTHLAKVTSRPPQPRLTMEEIHALADQAMEFIPRRVAFFAPKVGVTYNGITIRNQRSRWGSCSGKGNLNFNCLLMLCPPEVIDYVVVHELCHRKEMNHSPRFWAEVARILPNYREQEQWLTDNGSAIMTRMTG